MCRSQSMQTAGLIFLLMATAMPTYKIAIAVRRRSAIVAASGFTLHCTQGGGGVGKSTFTIQMVQGHFVEEVSARLAARVGLCTTLQLLILIRSFDFGSV